MFPATSIFLLIVDCCQSLRTQKTKRGHMHTPHVGGVDANILMDVKMFSVHMIRVMSII